MSAGAAIPLDDARLVAADLVIEFEDVCARIQIAGSIRRRKAVVHDIEIVVIPKIEDRVKAGLFADETEPVDLLEERLADLLARKVVYARSVENHRQDGSIDVQEKLGPAFKALVFDGIPVDLFIVRPPATWGVIFGLRTGPGDWNTRLVMDCKAIGRRVEGGQVVAWHGGSSSWKAIPTPEEADFFRALGQPWVEPRNRAVDRVEISRQVAAAGATR